VLLRMGSDSGLGLRRRPGSSVRDGRTQTYCASHWWTSPTRPATTVKCPRRSGRRRARVRLSQWHAARPATGCNIVQLSPQRPAEVASASARAKAGVMRDVCRVVECGAACGIQATGRVFRNPLLERGFWLSGDRHGGQTARWGNAGGKRVLVYGGCRTAKRANE
jgi:hypothetical protein